eukprot:scaffold57498_cov69-Phaeocystis_antarctica.AAC.5
MLSSDGSRRSAASRSSALLGKLGSLHMPALNAAMSVVAGAVAVAGAGAVAGGGVSSSTIA